MRVSRTDWLTDVEFTYQSINQSFIWIRQKPIRTDWSHWTDRVVWELRKITKLVKNSSKLELPNKNYSCTHIWQVCLQNNLICASSSIMQNAIESKKLGKLRNSRTQRLLREFSSTCRSQWKWRQSKLIFGRGKDGGTESRAPSEGRGAMRRGRGVWEGCALASLGVRIIFKVLHANLYMLDFGVFCCSLSRQRL